MIVVGERINGTGARVREAVVGRKSGFVVQQARLQAEAGANYIDVNAGTEPDREPEDMAWLVQTVQQAVGAPVCIDSSNPAALEAGLQVHRGRALLNSASAESARRDPVLALARKYDARVIALTLDDAGLPSTADQRLELALRMAEAARAAGIADDDLFIDPLVRPIGVETEQGAAFLDAVGAIRKALPSAHVICGLSNISYRMPGRRLLNRVFLAMAMARGLDAAILDPLDEGLMAVACAGETLLGRDEMCMHYIKAHRAGKLDG